MSQASELPSAVRFKISEIFDSVQGEGASVGLPCTFLRLAGCNLTCSWCDTPYSWDWSRFDPRQEIERRSIESVAQRLHSAERLVVTGGEPLLQRVALGRLFELLPATLPIEVETNGTQSPGSALLERVQQWNVSPKLSNSGEPEARRIQYMVLETLRETGRAWLKFVIAEQADATEAETLIQALAWPRQRVLFMPQAATRDALLQLLPKVQQFSASHAVGWCSRLHVERWDGRRGV